MKEFHNPPGIHSPVAGYSHQARLQGPQRLVVLSGQIGVRPDGSIPEDPIAQLEVVFDNIERNLEAAGMTIEDVFKINTYAVGDMDGNARRAIFAKRLKGLEPCMTLVFVAALAKPAYRIEVEAWASKEEGA